MNHQLFTSYGLRFLRCHWQQTPNTGNPCEQTLDLEEIPRLDLILTENELTAVHAEENQADSTAGTSECAMVGHRSIQVVSVLGKSTQGNIH